MGPQPPYGRIDSIQQLPLQHSADLVSNPLTVEDVLDGGGVALQTVLGIDALTLQLLVKPAAPPVPAVLP